jgi:uncharacterized protein YkwD
MRFAKQIAAVFAVVSCLIASAPAPAAPTSAERALLTEINRTRAAHGLRPLRVDLRLERAARAHSAWMLRTGTFAHGPFGRRIASYGARGPAVGENLAWGVGGSATPPGIIQGWLASPSHRANLLRRGFTRIGIGVRYGTFAGHRGAAVVTADFAGR